MSIFFGVTKYVALEHNSSVLHVSIILHISVLLTDHDQTHKYISHTYVSIHVEYY
jgi:hypothetical protein